mgnify:CR=1 FL=1
MKWLKPTALNSNNNSDFFELVTELGKSTDHNYRTDMCTIVVINNIPFSHLVNRNTSILFSQPYIVDMFPQTQKT